jgi:uncharacterized lipoprotein
LSLLDPLGWALDVAYEAHFPCDVLLICNGPFDGHWTHWACALDMAGLDKKESSTKLKQSI